MNGKSANVHIRDLEIDDVEAVADVMYAGFRASGGWSDLTPATALSEVRESLDAGRISRVASLGSQPVGWIGGEESYEGHVFELHPLVVRPDHQRRGIGRLLVNDFEQLVLGKGVRVITLGADDESNQTSLGGIDVFPNPLDHLQSIQNLGGHPFTFYQRMGYTVVGLVPDANGFGKPDIILAKRLAGL